MNFSSMNLRRRVACGVLLAGMLCSAHAQETADAAADAPTLAMISLPADQDQTATPQRAGDSEPTQLEEIVVTATKRPTSVRKIAGTVNVLSGEDLEREGVQSIDQIVSLVPGVNLTDEGTGGTAKRITIRGVSAGVNVNPTAGTLFGDIPFSDPFLPKVGLDPNPFDMATVEVLKGPQGTLFGGTGLNGLIRYVPEAPQLDDFHVKYYTQLQSYPGNGGSAFNYGAMINAPFADNTAAVRLVAFHRDSPGYTDNTRADGKKDVNTLEQYGVRGELTWLPADNWKVALMGTTQHTREDDLAYTSNYDGQLEHSDSPRASPAVYQYTLGSLNIDRTFDWADLISQTSYTEKKYNIFLEASRALGGIAPLLAGADANHSDGITQEFRLVSAPSESPWKWLAGAYYYKLHLYDCAGVGAAEGLPTLTVPGALEGVVANPCPGNVSRIGDELNIGQIIGDVDLQEDALFGELTRSFGDYWESTLGARVYRIQSGGTVSTSGVVYASANQGQAASRDADTEQRGVSPKASIVFHPTDDLRAYFTVSRGFRFGGPQIGASTPTTTVPTVYKSDSLWNYELGLRTDWLDRTLIADASLYYIDWTNPQVYQIDSTRTVGFIDNVGGAKGKGVEMSLRYLFPFLRGLSLDSAVALNHTVTTKAFASASGTEVPSGSPWPLSPRWQTSTTLAYTVPIDAWQAGASLRHTYLGQACNQIECTAQVFGYRTLDFNLFASGPDGSWWPRLSVTMNNLTDERGYGNITTNPAPASDTVNYIAPRSLVVRLSGDF
jgi:iron complex outermembrane receptor protein